MKQLTIGQDIWIITHCPIQFRVTAKRSKRSIGPKYEIQKINNGIVSPEVFLCNDDYYVSQADAYEAWISDLEMIVETKQEDYEQIAKEYREDIKKLKRDIEEAKEKLSQLTKHDKN